jgi:hypothetical protein
VLSTFVDKEEILRKAIIKTYQHYVDEIYEKLVQVTTITKEPSIQALIKKSQILSFENISNKFLWFQK